MTARAVSESPQYEPHERPPALVALGLGFQSALLCITPIVIFPIIFAQATGASIPELLWFVFAMLVVNGLVIILQAVRVGPIGSGLFVVTCPSAIAMPFCIVALKEGGPSTLAALVLASGLFQIAISMRLSLLRQLVTPTVGGTIILLMIITIVGVIFGKIDDVPEGAPSASGPVCIAVTFVVSMGLLLRGSGPWRTWAPLVGIGLGWAVAVAFGIYDLGPALEAPIVGLPLDGWPGLGLGLGLTFWSLLPAFLLLSAVEVLQANSVGLSIQQVSWRGPRAMDYRRVQGVGVCSGLGNLLAGLASVMPIITIPRGTAFVQQTGCASRDIALLTGAFLILVAFFPKSWGLLVGIPSPVSTVFLIVVITPVFVEGMKLIVRDSLDYRKSLVIGVSIAIGLGLQFELVVLPAGGAWGPMFQNGLTSGGVAVVLLTLASEFTGRRRRRIQAELNVDSLPRIKEFLLDFSASRGWNKGMAERTMAVAEEVVVILAGQNGQSGGDARKLLLRINGSATAAELEFVSAPSETENLEDRLAVLTEPASEMTELELPEREFNIEREASLRLLRYYASSVSHRQYHETEVITVRVEAATGQ